MTAPRRDPSPTPAAASDEPRWVAVLRRGPPLSDAAVADLRTYLLRALKRALGGRAGCDEAFLEDMAQEASLRVLAALAGFRGDSRFTTWATTVAVRFALASLRHARWKDVSLEAQLASRGPEAMGGDPGPGPDQLAQRAELRLAVARVVNEDLTERQRVALVAALNGMPLPEIAARLGTNLNAVYKLTHDARKKLKAGLAARGFGETDVRAVLEERPK